MDRFYESGKFRLPLHFVPVVPFQFGHFGNGRDLHLPLTERSDRQRFRSFPMGMYADSNIHDPHKNLEGYHNRLSNYFLILTKEYTGSKVITDTNKKGFTATKIVLYPSQKGNLLKIYGVTPISTYIANEEYHYHVRSIELKIICYTAFNMLSKESQLFWVRYRVVHKIVRH